MVLYDENHEKVIFPRFWRGKSPNQFVLNNEKGESLVTSTIQKPLFYLYRRHGLGIPNKLGVITWQLQTSAGSHFLRYQTGEGENLNIHWCSGLPIWTDDQSCTYSNTYIMLSLSSMQKQSSCGRISI